MSEYAALHEVSLLLVGSNIKVSRSFSTETTESTEEDLDSLCSDPVPDDELLMDRKHTKNITNKAQEETTGIEIVMQPKQDESDIVLVDDVTSGPDEARWRAHGLTRRRQILDEDGRNGGRKFTLSFDCSIQRYFSVAHWALEQFHQLYQSSSSINDQHKLEEIYVMGFRIISFLTECLPQHPGLSTAPFVQEQSELELNLLRKCLNDVALRIDECVCNEFVDDGDLFLDSMIAAQMEKEDAEEENSPKKTRRKSKKSFFTSDNDEQIRLESWVDFNEFKKLEQKTASDRQNERKMSESPTSETVGTSGTASLEPLDSSDTKSNSSVNSQSGNENENESITRRKKEEIEEEDYFCDDDRVIRDDMFEIEMDTRFEMDDWSISSYSSRPMTLLRKSVSLDFLKTIACEPVLYETDSEAADSWANGEGNTVDSKSRPCLPSSSGVTPTSDPARIAFRDLMSKIPHKSILQRDNTPRPSFDASMSPRPSSPTFSDIMEERDNVKVLSIDDDSLDDVVDHEIQEYLNKVLGKQEKKYDKMDRKLRRKEQTRSKQEGKAGKLDNKLRRKEHKRDKQEGKAGKLDNKLRKDEQRRDKLNQKLGNGSRAQSGLRSGKKDPNKKLSVSFDDSSSSSSHSTGTPSSSYTSLASLRRKTGSQTSAFSSYGGAKQNQQQQKQKGKPARSKNNHVQDDWISFDNFASDGSYFSNDSN